MKTVILVVIGALLGAGAVWTDGAIKTCGAAIAEDAELPTRLADLAAARADAYDAHAAYAQRTATIDDLRPEIDGLHRLALYERDASSRSRRLADQMQRAAQWPPVTHDLSKLPADPKYADASKRIIAIEKDLAVLFEKDVAERERATPHQ